MSLIKSVVAQEILDSRGTPTLKVFIHTSDGCSGEAAVPSGASTGEHEAIELRDGDPKRYFGKGVQKAVAHVNGPIAALLSREKCVRANRLDKAMIAADGTENKSHFGANAIFGASLALAKTASRAMRIPLYRYIGGSQSELLPCPMMNILNGGVHADNGLEFQEFMVRPVGAPSFHEALRYGAEIFHTLKNLLKKRGIRWQSATRGVLLRGLAPMKRPWNSFCKRSKKRATRGRANHPCPRCRRLFHAAARRSAR